MSPLRIAAQLDGVEGVPPNPGPICQNGDVFLGYGSAAFIGLGFSVMIMLVFIEASEMTAKAAACCVMRD